jgi:two-component system response regulator HupR/HoxA
VAAAPAPAPATLDEDAQAVLLGYPWPGNIRELRNEIARALALSDGDRLGAADFSAALRSGQTGVATAAAPVPLPGHGTLQQRLDAIEAMLVREVMLRLRWNKTQAARELGLSRVGLRAKLQRFGLEARAVDKGQERAP